jgi:chemotaxis protein MotA
MNYFLGLVVALIGFFAATVHLQQELHSYWDFVAFAVVGCGTLAVMLMTMPKMPFFNGIWKTIVAIVRTKKNKKAFLELCFNVVAQNRIGKLDLTRIENRMIVDGIEMVDLGFAPEKIEAILADRFFHYRNYLNLISQWLKRSAKYPPAFGLAATVLGLIHLMRGISTGIDPKETGLRMAVALVATFYGILIANLVLNPLAENINERIKEDELFAEVAIKTVLMTMKGENLLESQEILNSYAETKEKIDIGRTFLVEGAA